MLWSGALVGRCSVLLHFSSLNLVCWLKGPFLCSCPSQSPLYVQILLGTTVSCTEIRSCRRMRVKGHIGTKKNKNKEKAWEWEYFNDSLIRRSGGKKKKTPRGHEKKRFIKNHRQKPFPHPLLYNRRELSFVLLKAYVRTFRSETGARAPRESNSPQPARKRPLNTNKNNRLQPETAISSTIHLRTSPRKLCGRWSDKPCRNCAAKARVTIGAPSR